MTLDPIGTTLGLGSADLKVVVLSTVSFVLGLLALIQTIMVLYSGFIWLTARGDDERRHEAKMTLLRSVVGTLIVCIAWGIVLFLFRLVERATT